MTRVGIICRADNRGLGIMTWEAYRHLQPERVLVVREPGAEARGFVPHLDRYPDATVVHFAGGMLPEAEVREWLTGLDVVYTAETFYDWHMVAWAAEAGVATVLHSMPEFYSPAHPVTSELWAPTPWRLEHLPAGTPVVPVPVADDRFPFSPPDRDGPLRVLHVAGHRAAADRNGTTLLLQALRTVREPMRVRLLTQDPVLPRVRPLRHVELDCEPGGRENYWDLYADADVLVLPRRYGGLCLPAQEAMASGLAVVMSDCPPNDGWPTLRVPVRTTGALTTAAGEVRIHSAHPRALAAVLDELAADEGLLRKHQQASVEWARAHSWAALASLYRERLAAAVVSKSDPKEAAP